MARASPSANQPLKAMVMRSSIRTQPKIGYVPRRRRKKTPSSETLHRIEWLKWLVEEFGGEAASQWLVPPVTYEAWCRSRQLQAHEAA